MIGNMQFFQELYSHIDKNSGEKFEDMLFLVKIANKETSLSGPIWYQIADPIRTGSTRSRVQLS